MSAQVRVSGSDTVQSTPNDQKTAQQRPAQAMRRGE